MMKSGDFYLGSRTRDSANRRSALKRSATVACITSDTRHRGGALKSRASVRIPGSTVAPEIKISRFHQNLDLLDRDSESRRSRSIMISCGILLSSPSVVLGRQSCPQAHRACTSSCVHVVLPLWLTVVLETPNHFVRYPDYSLLLGQIMILPCRMNTSCASSQDVDEIWRFSSRQSNLGFREQTLGS